MNINSSHRRSRILLVCLLLIMAGGVGLAFEEKPRIIGVKAVDASTLTIHVRADASLKPVFSSTDFKVNGQPIVALGRQSATIYQEKKGRGGELDYPQLILHEFIARLEAPLSEKTAYRVTSPFGAANVTFDSRATVCESIKFNQVGYGTRSTKRFAFFAPNYGDMVDIPATSVPTRFEVISVPEGRAVLTGALEACDPDERVGGPVWRMDLAGISTPGVYMVSLPGVGCSETFSVGDAASHHSFFVHMKGLYHQRCGVALEKPYTNWTRPACHTTLGLSEAEPPNFIKAPSSGKLTHNGGGHHDAGDFDIRLSHTVVAGYLLNAFELFPSKFLDQQLTIPESNNGVPDLVDEALFSIAAWEVLQQADGGIRGGWEAERHPTYGEVTAATDLLEYKTYRAHGHTTLAGSALMAYAARVVRPFDAKRAEALLLRARNAWSFYEKRQADPAFKWTPGARLYAACQLYLATGDASFHAAMREPAEEVFGLKGKTAKFPTQYMGHLANLNYIDAGMVFTHYFMGYLLDEKLAKDPELVKVFRAELLRRADEVLKATERKGFAIYKLGDWGMSTATGRYGDYLLNAFRLTNDPRYYDAAALLADWQLGANPGGRCFTTGLGWRPPYTPLQCDSHDTIQRGIGPVPGISVYGITASVNAPPYVKAVTQHLHPDFNNRPLARRYTDGWSVVMQNEFTVWETMAPSAFLHACLAPDTPLMGAKAPMGEVRIPGGYPVQKLK
jgi:endoglucanase